MMRLAHIWICVALAQCQPVPAAEMETDAKGPILRLSEAEALSCGSEQGCNLYTDAAIKRITEQAYFVPLHTYVSTYAFQKQLDFKPYADELPRFYLAKWK